MSGLRARTGRKGHEPQTDRAPEGASAMLLRTRAQYADALIIETQNRAGVG